ncbi:MAG: hypothetical protein IJP89_09095 [Synergistaceae bacterium]|nr:hypothetical protein [Synergistaceae bacterium]
MPFLRAALRKKQEALQEEILRPPVVVPAEEVEIEPELPEPTTIAELHSLIDRRTEEAEFEPETAHDEPEIPAETENETLAGESASVEDETPDTLTDEAETLPEEAVAPVGGDGEQHEALTGESTETASAENDTPDELPDETAEAVNTESEQPDTLTGEATETVSGEGEEPEALTDETAETVSSDDETPESLTGESAETANGDGEQPEVLTDEPEAFELKYDFTSGERYVDKVSTKTEFDRMLDELAAISKDLLSWEAEKFAREYAGRFNEGNDSSQADARKYEAFLGGYITNAAMLLYDKGYREAAIKQLEQAKSILEARKKLEDETSAIKSRVEEQNDTVDLSDILGLFGDG